jgi:mono/diheme cytochrome c family protein
MRTLFAAIACLVILHAAQAADLCGSSTYTRAQAEQGRLDYNSSCGLCHQYNLMGREPGNAANESPDIGLLDENYIRTVDGNGGVIPPLLNEQFFRKWKDQKAFADRISDAIGAFPPKDYVKPDSDARIAAYILFKNCGRL